MTAKAPVPMPSAAPEPQTLRSALGRFATGVTIITCRDADGTPVGLTANSFAALSLDPPLVLWSLRRASSRLAQFDAASHFAVNVLAEDQVAMSRRFASSEPDKFAEGRWHDGQGGAPVLAGSAAVFECATEARHETGDHVLYIGRVLRLAERPTAPLLFLAGHYRTLGHLL